MLNEMSARTESFPMILYGRFCKGESVGQLAAAFGIPEERVELRLRAAAIYAQGAKGGSSMVDGQ